MMQFFLKAKTEIKIRFCKCDQKIIGSISDRHLTNKAQRSHQTCHRPAVARQFLHIYREVRLFKVQ